MDQQFAKMTWESRWNENTGPCVALSQNGSNVMLLTMMGSVQINLDYERDVASFCAQMKQALDLLKRTKLEYDTAMMILDV